MSLDNLPETTFGEITPIITQHNNDNPLPILTPIVQQYFLLNLYPKPRAYRIQRVLLDNIPFYHNLLIHTNSSPQQTKFYLPGRIHNDTVEILLRFLDHHLLQPYPIYTKPITQHFIEKLHIFDLTLLSSTPHSLLFELAMLCNYLGLVELFDMISAYLSLQFNNLTESDFLIKMKEMNGDYYFEQKTTPQRKREFQNIITKGLNTNNHNNNSANDSNGSANDSNDDYDITERDEINTLGEVKYTPNIQEAMVAALFGGVFDS